MTQEATSNHKKDATHIAIEKKYRRKCGEEALMNQGCSPAALQLLLQTNSAFPIQKLLRHAGPFGGGGGMSPCEPFYFSSALFVPNCFTIH